MLKFQGKRMRRLLLRSIFSDPLPEGHPVDGQFFSCLMGGGSWSNMQGRNNGENLSAQSS